MKQTLDYMVPPRRFERLTYGLGIRCSILLSYGGLLNFQSVIIHRFSWFVQGRLKEVKFCNKKNKVLSLLVRYFGEFVFNFQKIFIAD